MKIILPWFAARLSAACVLTGCPSPKAGPRPEAALSRETIATVCSINGNRPKCPPNVNPAELGNR
jgi:hypothetical protein